MEHGYPSLREIEKLCKVDIRFIWLRDEMKAPSYAKLCDFINQERACSLEEIVQEINSCIFGKENVDLDYVYIYGTKIEANAKKYSWVWKRAVWCTRFLPQKLSTAIMSRKKQTLSVSGEDLQFLFGVI